MKKMLILGGYPQMIEIVSTAKAMGIYTVVTDRDPTSVAKRFADQALNISTDKIDDLVDFCKNEEIDAVFTGFEDFNIHNALMIAKRTGLPFYATEEQIRTVTNKNCFKEKCREYGVPVIEQYTLCEAIEQARYPYIIKPADSYGSRGITVAASEQELYLGYEKARTVSPTNSVVIERFLDSDHGVELFYTAVNGNIHLTVTADRYVVRSGKTTVPLPVAEVFPSRHRDELLDKLDGKIRQMLSGIGIQNGLVLIQALYDGAGEFFVYEMAYRFTGEQHYRLVEKQRGVSLAKMMISLALGDDISSYDSELLDDVSFTKPSINLAIVLNEGKIAKIEGLESVFLLDEVVSYNLTHRVNDTISPSGDYSHMLIRINMVAENYGALCRAVRAVNDLIAVESDSGEDMLTARFVLPE